MPITENDVTGLRDGDVISTSGDKIGSIGQVYLDDQTGEPTFVTVNTGLFGLKLSFVPLQGARVQDGDLVVNYDKETVKDAPRVDDDGSLSPEEEDELYSYYGIGGAGTTTDGYDTRTPTDVGTTTDAGYDARTTTADTGYDAGTTTDTDTGTTSETGYTGTLAGDIPTLTSAGAGRRADEGIDADDRTGARDTETAFGATDESASRVQDIDSETDRGTAGDAAITTQPQEMRRPRLRRYVVVESVILTAPVQGQEVQQERQPGTDENVDDAASGPTSSNPSTR